MSSSNLDWRNKLEMGQSPTPFAVLGVPLGNHVFGSRDMWAFAESQISDMLSWSGRVKSFGVLSRLSSSSADSLPLSFMNKQLSHISMVLDNADGLVSLAMADSPFLGGSLKLYLGFEGMDLADMVVVFSGTINRIKITETELVIEAREG